MNNFASLCILSYNRPEYLANTLASLEVNTKEPYELIIHDDGSDPPIDYDVDQILIDTNTKGATIIMNKPGHNQGQGVALNRMFGMAKGNPIIKLDSDLEYTPGWLEKVNSILELNDKNFVETSDPMIGLLGLLHYHHDPVDSVKTFMRGFTGWTQHTHILGSAFAVRRECWNQIKPFEEYSDAFAEDVDFQFRVRESDNYVVALPNEDLVKNIGMGLGNSTVVTTDAQGNPTVTKIKKGPYVINE